MTFQTNFYYDLPQVLQWEIQRFIAPEKPTRHPDAASIIKAKNDVVYHSWDSVKILQVVQTGSELNDHVYHDINDTLRELVLPEILSPTSFITMCKVNIGLDCWVAKSMEMTCLADYPPLYKVMRATIKVERVIRFKKGTRIKACEV